MDSFLKSARHDSVNPGPSYVSKSRSESANVENMDSIEKNVPVVPVEEEMEDIQNEDSDEEGNLL